MECILESKSQLKFLYILQDFLISEYAESQSVIILNYDYYNIKEDFTIKLIWEVNDCKIEIIPTIETDFKNIDIKFSHKIYNDIALLSNITYAHVRTYFSLDQEISFDLQKVMKKLFTDVRVS